MAFNNISICAADTPQALEALDALTAEHGNCAIEDADVIVPLGGDRGSGFAVKR